MEMVARPHVIWNKGRTDTKVEFGVALLYTVYIRKLLLPYNIDFELVYLIN
jgi:hypothetical protein